MLLTVGCSAFHGVSVVSHGEETASVEEPVSANVSGAGSSAPNVVSATPSFDQEKQDDPSPATPTLPPAPVSPARLSFLMKKSVIEEDIFAQSAADTTLPWTLQDIFFDYDQMSIRQDAIPLLEQNAKVILKRYANREVLIQGHCDERGTEAYNLILGERRAKAVKDFLVKLGVADSRLRVLSLGKSQPFCLERTIPCFKQNRRAHFVLK